MAFIDHQQEILWEIVQQGKGRLARSPAVKIPGIVLDALAIADLLHHLHVVAGPLLQPLGFHQPVRSLQLRHPGFHILFDLLKGRLHLFPAGGIMASRENGHVGPIHQHLAGEHVYLADPVDLIAKKFHPECLVRPIGRKDIQHIPFGPEGTPGKIVFVALVLDVHQPAHYVVPVDLHALAQGNGQLQIFLRVPQGIDAAHRRHDDHIPPLVQGAGGAVAQLIDLIVHRGHLFNVGVRGGDIGLRLVIVVIGDEILHRAVREKCLQLPAQLGGQGLVMGDDQGRPLHPLDHLGHGEGLAAARHSQQYLEPVPPLNPFGQGVDGLGLIPLGGEGGYHPKLVHGRLFYLEIHGNTLFQIRMEVFLHRHMGGMIRIYVQGSPVLQGGHQGQVKAAGAAHKIRARLHADQPGYLAYQIPQLLGNHRSLAPICIFVANDMFDHGFYYSFRLFTHSIVYHIPSKTQRLFLSLKPRVGGGFPGRLPGETLGLRGAAGARSAPARRCGRRGSSRAPYAALEPPPPPAYAGLAHKSRAICPSPSSWLCLV